MSGPTQNPAALAAWTLLVKVAFLALLCTGWVQGEAGARNVITFLVYLSAFISFLVLFCESCQRRSRDEGLPLPLWLYGALGVAAVVMLAGHGELWLATLKVFSLAVKVAVCDRTSESRVQV